MLNESLQETVSKFEKENLRIEKQQASLKSTIEAVKQSNELLSKKNGENGETLKELQDQLTELQSCVHKYQQDLISYEERQTTILTELNRLKETVMDSNNLLKQTQSTTTNTTSTTSNTNVNNPMAILAISSSSMRSIPAPSKVMVDDQKKKDNRLVELKRITKDYMEVTEEEASLRLYKLQKTMIHVVSDLKKYMTERNEDISKSWKSIDMSTQRVAFEMVEREAVGLGVPLNMCIGYWGARRLISKSWANALRTTKKHIKSGSKIIYMYNAHLT